MTPAPANSVLRTVLRAAALVFAVGVLVYLVVEAQRGAQGGQPAGSGTSSGLDGDASGRQTADAIAPQDAEAGTPGQDSGAAAEPSADLGYEPVEVPAALSDGAVIGPQPVQPPQHFYGTKSMRLDPALLFPQGRPVPEPVPEQPLSSGGPNTPPLVELPRQFLPSSKFAPIHVRGTSVVPEPAQDPAQTVKPAKPGQTGTGTQR